MLITGSIPYNSLKHRKQLIKELKQEFGIGLIMRFTDDLIIYEYIDRERLRIAN
ncbi:hypothetical protein [Lederbergia lenta]|uniref:hypothetical protein n=1 Tax=Lederbergia lenta TaxID=1467 RepID=UPI00203D0476|nr:hypothetical protein [Lederbergia lenta]MCM3109958.1 hypothetical protein [Lederbergia lenta]